MKLKCVATLLMSIMMILLVGSVTISNAEVKVLDTKYHLDVGVYFTWGAGNKFPGGMPDSWRGGTTHIVLKAPSVASRFRVVSVKHTLQPVILNLKAHVCLQIGIKGRARLASNPVVSVKTAFLAKDLCGLQRSFAMGAQGKGSAPWKA